MKLYPLFMVMIVFVMGCDKAEDSKLVTDPNPAAIGEVERELLHWFQNQQLPNGTLESVEDGNIVSLYDNALAAMVFMLHDDYEKAEKIFDFFNARIDSELKAGVGGFSQLRDRNGVPNNHRWMGDNAWLLIALNNYKAQTGNTTYDELASEIEAWLLSLQDFDGGLFAGYDANNRLLNYKVTEGMIDAFNAVQGYTSFHSHLLDFLEVHRWIDADRNLVSWPGNPDYLYALDLHPWSYLIFNDYPVSSLSSAERYLTTQISTATGQEITGYCFDEDRDVVWLEGTAQMSLAFDWANMNTERDFYLSEMEKNLMESEKYTDAAGFPYASNHGTSYGGEMLWETADDKIAISSGAWYIFTKRSFNPFAVERDKNIPMEDMFWID